MIQVDRDLLLKPVSVASADEIFASIDSSRAHLRPWLPFVDQTMTVDDTRRFIKSVLNSNCVKKDKVFEIRHKNDFAGLIALKETDLANMKTEIGYWLDTKYTGKGIMTKACRALIDYVFNHMKLNRITIKVAETNRKSLALPVALGFSNEGVERQGEMVNGKYLNLLIFGVLRNEWER